MFLSLDVEPCNANIWPKPAELTSPAVPLLVRSFFALFFFFFKANLALYKGQEAGLPNDFSEENGSPVIDCNLVSSKKRLTSCISFDFFF